MIINSIKGNFGFIIRADNDIWYICTDIAKSYTIFYDTDLSIISDCSDLIVKEKGLSEETYDLKNLGAMVASSYTLHGQTVFCDVMQCEAGQIIKLDTKRKTAEKYRYYAHVTDRLITDDESIFCYATSRG